MNLILIHFQLCQIQLQQLQIMGVAQEHCEQILDNVDILRQSILGGMVHNNPFKYDTVINESMIYHAFVPLHVLVFVIHLLYRSVLNRLGRNSPMIER